MQRTGAKLDLHQFIKIMLRISSEIGRGGREGGEPYILSLKFIIRDYSRCLDLLSKYYHMYVMKSSICFIAQLQFRRLFFFSKWIMSMASGSNATQYFQINNIIDGMTVDVVNRRLFWTDAMFNQILYLNFTNDGYSLPDNYGVVITNLSKPRAIKIYAG